MVPHHGRVAPHGITFYDHELGHNPSKLGCSEAYHGFIGTMADGSQYYFHCFTRKTVMPPCERSSLLRMQLMAQTLSGECEDAAVEALSSLPLFDTTVLCAVTANCWMSTMRHAMTAFAASIPTTATFTVASCDALFHQLSAVTVRRFAVSIPQHRMDDGLIAFTPVADDDSCDEGASPMDGTVHVSLQCLTVGSDTICLPPVAQHSWERVPQPLPLQTATVVGAPDAGGSVSGAPTPLMQSPMVSHHSTPIPGGKSSSRPSFPPAPRRLWSCPSCSAKPSRLGPAAPNTPTHWCLCCRKCNLCVPHADDQHPLFSTCASPLPRHDVDLGIVLSTLDARNVILVLLSLMCDRLVGAVPRIASTALALTVI